MTKAEVVQALQEIRERDRWDPECDHIDAEESLFDYLRENGQQEIADEYEKTANEVGFWYA